MSKKVLAISTSLRNNSNSDILINSFIEGAEDSGNVVEKINIAGKSIGFCKGCLTCQRTEKCIIKDDMNEICEKMKEADVIAFATPIYYYEMSSQLKTVLDRANPLFVSDYAFRDIYFISTASEDASTTDKRAISGMNGWIECFPKARLAGSVFAGGVTAPGEIDNHPSLKKAYEMGKNI